MASRDLRPDASQPSTPALASGPDLSTTSTTSTAPGWFAPEAASTARSRPPETKDVASAFFENFSSA